jgi:ATP synthase protein I
VGNAAFAPSLAQNGNAVIAIDLPNPRRLALSVVLGQAVVALLCALASWAIADTRAGISALLGGGISSLASLAMAMVGFGKQAATDPQRAIRAFLVGETAKVGVVIVLFVVVLKTMKVVPLAMLGSYIATFFVFWVALANALPPLGGAGKSHAFRRRAESAEGDFPQSQNRRGK